MRKQRVTIKDVAAAAGVHASTVSRVLNQQTREMVSAEVAEKVMRIAHNLGYLRNPLASGLRTRRSQTVGVLIPDLTNPIFPPIVRGIERTLGAHGYVAVLADSDNSSQNEQALIQSLMARQVDGLILATAHRKDPVVDACLDMGIPLVLVNRTLDKRNVTSVVNDDERGIRLAFEHLRQLGHERIAYVGGPQNTSTGYARYRTFLKLIKRFDLKIERDLIVNGDSFTEEAGYACMKQILSNRASSFTAVITANDLLALGCFDALDEFGLQCPRDVSITGFNYMRFLERVKPRLTTVQIPHDELGVQAALFLLERIRNPESPAQTVRLIPHLLVAESTRPLHSAEARTSAARGTLARARRAMS